MNVQILKKPKDFELIFFRVHCTHIVTKNKTIFHNKILRKGQTDGHINCQTVLRTDLLLDRQPDGRLYRLTDFETHADDTGYQIDEQIHRLIIDYFSN